MEYDIDHDQANADPKHCTAVLQQEKQVLEEKIYSLLEKFIDRTDLKITSIAVTTQIGCRGGHMLTGLKIQFDL